MNTVLNFVAPPRSAVASAIEDALRAIAPSWPLDRQIAVNPYWGFIDRSFDQAAATLRRLVGSRFTLDPSEYLAAWRAGEITRAYSGDGDRQFRFIVTGLERSEVLDGNDNLVGHDGVGIGTDFRRLRDAA